MPGNVAVNFMCLCSLVSSVPSVTEQGTPALPQKRGLESGLLSDCWSPLTAGPPPLGLSDD